MIDAREVRLKAQRPTQKSDRRDAYELCDGCGEGSIARIVHVPPRPVARVRETLARRRHFVRLETAQVNAVKRFLRGAGLGHLSRSLGTEVGWAKLLAALAGHEELRDYVALHHAVWGCARAQRVGAGGRIDRAAGGARRSRRPCAGSRPSPGWGRSSPPPL